MSPAAGTPPARSRVLHVITTTDCGGAEMMLYKLLARLDPDTFDCGVVAMTDVGPVGRQIQALGVPVHALGMRRGVPDPRGLTRLARWIRRESPHLVHAWMAHANLLAGLAARLAGGPPVVWGIQQGAFDALEGSRRTWWLSWLGGRLAPWLSARTVFCAESGRQAHARLGYPEDRITVIPNGFDLAEFRPDPAARDSVRRELAVPPGAPLVGLFARFDPQKDHRTFLRAAGRLVGSRPDVHFVCCGDGITPANAALAGWIAHAGVDGRCHLLGRRDDMPRLTAALDVATCSSTGEGCPNVVGEAMACGIPAVATDVGDAALMVGDAGRVVPPRHPDALARAWVELLALPEEARRSMGQRARARIRARFSLEDVARQYAGLYGELRAARPDGATAALARRPGREATIP